MSAKASLHRLTCNYLECASAASLPLDTQQQCVVRHFSIKTFQIRSEAISLRYTLSVEVKVLGDRLVGYKLREIAAERKFSQELKFEVLEQVLPVAQIEAVLANAGRIEQRERKLNMVVTVLMLIVMHF